MEISTIPVSGVPQFNAPVTKTVSTDPTPAIVPQAAPEVQFPVADTGTADTTTSTDANQQQEEAAARQAALSFKNSYPLGDTKSVTYKDVNGTPITRSVSLRDGTVTYSPKPQYVRSILV